MVIAALLLIGIGSLAGRELRPLEVVIAALVLVAMTLGIFVWGLGLPIQVWPELVRWTTCSPISRSASASR